MSEKSFKYLITKDQKAVWTVLMGPKKALEIHLAAPDGSGTLKNICVGRVRDVVTNIHAAFVELGDGQQGFYSLDANQKHLLANSCFPNSCFRESSSLDSADFCETGSCFSQKKLRPGDEIIVQIEREAVKTKDPVLTSCLNLTGRYAVLTAGKPGFGISSKIMDNNWKKQAKAELEPFCAPDFGFILRTNAQNVPFSVIRAEMELLRERFYQILKKGQYATCYSVLYQEDAPYLSGLRDMNTTYLEEIVTDIPEIYEEVKVYLSLFQPELQSKLRYYQDALLPLAKCYSLQDALDKALRKQVWLKSGGYLVIEPTEALTVIDVNTGKFNRKKTPQETVRKINLEAAVAAGEEIRLRNLSGIIVIDFIDMESEEDDRELLRVMTAAASSDPVKTVVVDMTPLHLMEITRKKVSRPLAEQAKLYRMDSVL